MWAGYTCSDNPCGLVACCESSGTCENLTLAACQALAASGVTWSNGPCADFPCSAK
jgi:hypothetical protein